MDEAARRYQLDATETSPRISRGLSDSAWCCLLLAMSGLSPRDRLPRTSVDQHFWQILGPDLIGGRFQVGVRPPAMGGHHVMLKLRPVLSGHFEAMYSDEEEPFIRRHYLSRRQLEERFSSCHLRTGIVDAETSLLDHLSASRFLEALARIDATSGGCPVSLTGKRSPLVLEPEQKKPVFAV